ncbi:MAG: hypothetical protein ABS939_02990 [Psychrobacillus sp.]
MNGDSIVWLIIVLSIVICDGLAVFLYFKKRFPIWGSAIIIALLVPVIVYSYLSLEIDYSQNNTGPDDMGEEMGFAGGFIALVLAFNAIIMFVIGVILNIATFVNNKKNRKKSHVL